MFSAVHVLEREALPSLYRAVIPLPKLGFRGGLPQFAGLFPSHVVVLPPLSRWGSSFSFSLSSFISSLWSDPTHDHHHQKPNPSDPFPKDLSHCPINPFSYRLPKPSVTTMKPPQIHLGQTVTSTAASATLTLTNPLPSNVTCYLRHGAKSLSGNPPMTPPAYSDPRALELRPPPEPPPQFKEEDRVGLLTPFTVTLHRFVTTSAALGFVVPFRPPRKPPWVRLDVFGCLVSGHCCYSALLVFWFYLLCFSNFWSQNAYLVFAECPHRTPGCLSTWLWPWLHYLETVRTFGAATSSDHLSYYHLVSVSRAQRVNLETIFSRTEHTLVKDIIRNWIVRKTAESHTMITSTRVLKLLLTWMLGWCVWVGYASRDSNLSRCNGSIAYILGVVVSFKVVNPSFRFGNVQPLLLHVSCNDDLIIN